MSLKPGDEIISVNSRYVGNLFHDQVVTELRHCGPQACLTIRSLGQGQTDFQSGKKIKPKFSVSNKKFPGEKIHKMEIDLSFIRLQIKSRGENQ